ncbi:hypothetical protein SUDANB95_03404 [Actinosynnema sp. ALI-1.44]
MHPIKKLLLVLAAVLLPAGTTAVGAATASQPATPAGPFTYKNGATGTCLDLLNGDPASGTPIQLHPCYVGPPQQWHRDLVHGNVYRLRNAGTGKCVDGFRGRGVQVTQWICDATVHTQHWYREVRSNGRIVFRNEFHDNQCLDAAGATGPAVILWDCWYGPPQQWY